MFTAKIPNRLVLASILVAALIVLSSLLLLKSQANPVLAQGGGEDTQDSNYQAMQDQPPEELILASVEAGGGEGDIGPQSDNSGVEVVPIGAFRHDGNNANGWFHSFAGGSINNSSSSFACFMAPTYPPGGATLTQFRFSLTDDSPTSDLTVLLRRVRLTTGVVDIIAGGVVTGRDNPAAIEAVDNTMAPGTAVVSKDYAYYVTLCIDANTGIEIRLYGARLFYTPVTP
jgi:hypothetical protein